MAKICLILSVVSWMIYLSLVLVINPYLKVEETGEWVIIVSMISSVNFSLFVAIYSISYLVIRIIRPAWVSHSDGVKRIWIWNIALSTGYLLYLCLSYISLNSMGD